MTPGQNQKHYLAGAPELTTLVSDVEGHVHLNGSWHYKPSDFYCDPAATGAVEQIAAEEQTMVAA